MTKIEWTDATWNPVTGCDKVSQGCKNCYAEVMHKRLMGMFPQKYSKPFLGNVQFHAEELDKPKSWKKPLKIFVNSMSDLFHEDLDFNYIREIFEIMRAADWHTYQILTKRPRRILEFIQWFTNEYVIPFIFPKNVWIGVSCEDQKTADERIPLLLKVPATIRFISCEPLLGPIKLHKYVEPATLHSYHLHKSLDIPVIDWVIVGGESGRNARPMHPDWVRSIRDECKVTNGGFGGVAFFFKQWGEWMPLEFDVQPPFRFFSSNRKLIDGHGIDVMDHSGDPGKYHGMRFMDPMDAITFCMEHKDDQVDFLRRSKEKFPAMIDGKQHFEFPITQITNHLPNEKNLNHHVD